MNPEPSPIVRKGFVIFINTFCQGPTPSVSDENGYCVFETELEAQKDIIDGHLIRIDQFLEGERDYDDAITIDEYVVPVFVHADGTLTDGNGNPVKSQPD
jgi:hypothetical protein